MSNFQKMKNTNFITRTVVKGKYNYKLTESCPTFDQLKKEVNAANFNFVFFSITIRK